jgi:Transglutaminase-like superfamily
MEDTLTAVVARARRVPTRYREFRRTREDAAWQHKIDEPTLQLLLDLGFPAYRSGAGVLFDDLDLANASLELRLPSARMLAMRGWRGALTALDASPARYTLTVRPRCPDPAHGPDCRLTVSSGLRQAAHDEGRVDGSDFHVERSVLGRPPLLTGAHRAAIEQMRPLDFYLLPWGLRDDLGFVRETGMADCVLAARLLLEDARSSGIRTRFSQGVFLASPFSIVHCWTEFEVDGSWLPVDPHLLRTLSRLDLLDSRSWPPYRCLGDAAWRVHDDDLPFATDGNRSADVSLPTSRTAG